MRILGFTTPNSGVGYHRIMMPLVNMQKEYLLLTDTITEEIFDKKFDIVVINRFIGNEQLDIIKELRSKFNFKLVVDNDDYWYLPPSHPLHEFYQGNDLSDRIIELMQIADLCTCTHERLANEIYKLNKNVEILPNGLPYGREQFMDNKVESELVRFFWSGSGTHEKDIDILKNPMKRCLGLPIRTIVAGYHDSNKPMWDRIIGAFTFGLKLNPSIYKHNDVYKYMAAYADSDVSLIPLVDDTFNSMKSNLKVLETAAKKNPAIVSEVNPYLGLPVHYVKKQTDWYKHIKNLTYDKDMREESGLQLYEYCNKNFNIDLINVKRYDIYKKII